MRAETHFDVGAGPGLAYVPGIDGTGDFLFGTADRLRERFRVVALRYRPEESEVPPAQGYRRLAASVARRLDDAGLDRALVLAESFGVAVALQLALDHPDRVAGLALVNGFARFPHRLRAAAAAAAIGLAPAWAFRGARGLAVVPFLIAPRRDPELLARFRAGGTRRLDAGYRTRLALIRALDLRPRLSEVRVPVALFAATHDRILDSVRAAREMAAGLPDARLEVIERAGHLVLPLADEPWADRLQALAARAG